MCIDWKWLHEKIDSIKVKRLIYSVHFVYHIIFIRWNCNVLCFTFTSNLIYNFILNHEKTDVKHNEIICTSTQIHNKPSHILSHFIDTMKKET